MRAGSSTFLNHHEIPSRLNKLFKGEQNNPYILLYKFRQPLNNTKKFREITTVFLKIYWKYRNWRHAPNGKYFG